MRSVALMPGMPKLTPLQAPKFGKAPVLGLPKPSAGLGKPRNSFTVTQEWNSTVSPSWNVKGEDLELVPVDFPLERTHREIHCDASEVAKRISTSLQVMSIDAVYDNEKAKAKCKTMECVKFRIRLFSGGENGQPVVVEVQRRSGSTSSFMRSCRAVLDAAEGGDSTSAASKAMKAGKFPAPMKNLSGMKCLQSVEVGGHSPQEEAGMAFDSAANLCKSNKHDSVILGLQSLCSLTDPIKTAPKVSTQVASWVLLGHETHSIRDDLTAALNAVTGEDDEELTGIVEQQKHFALIAFSNALDMLTKDGSLGGAVEKDAWFESALVPALLVAVKQAGESASNAYAATRGLNCLLSCANAFSLRVLEENNGLESLKMAHEIGLAAHDLLAGEAGRCLEAAKGFS